MAALLHHVHILPVKTSFLNNCVYLLTRDIARKVIPGANFYYIKGNRHISISVRCGTREKYSQGNNENESGIDESESRSKHKYRDFFGINEYNARPEVEEDVHTKEPIDKYKTTQKINRNMLKTAYGSVRFDHKNAAVRKERKSHKQKKLRTVDVTSNKDPRVPDSNSIDSQYFGLLKGTQDKKYRKSISEESARQLEGERERIPTNYIEQQYFPSSDRKHSSHSKGDGHEEDQKHGRPEYDLNCLDQQLLNTEPSQFQNAPQNVKSTNSTSKSDLNIIDEQYFAISGSDNSMKSAEDVYASGTNLDQSTTQDDDFNYFDQQLFPGSEYEQSKQPQVENVPQNVLSASTTSTSDLTSINEQDFATEGSDLMKSTGSADTSATDRDHMTTEDVDLNYLDQQYFGQPSQHLKSARAQGKESGSWSERKQRINRGKVAARDSDVKNQGSQEAFDVAMKIRREIRETKVPLQKDREVARSVDSKGFRILKGEVARSVDSKGFRILKGQVPDVNRMPTAELVDIIKNSILYDKNDVVAINKPYGLPSHGGPGVHVSVAHLLPSLARQLDSRLDTLHLVHRLDKETTGVMLLARTPEVAWKLHNAFRRREVKKAYWVLTKGVPNPTSGIIDIPMAEGTVVGRHRMVLKPDYTEETRMVMRKSSVNAFEAVTRYSVITSRGNAALVECNPVTGLKHQIRAHLAFGLNTPVLGDHKYSHLTKMAPQRLHPDLLQKLKIRQSKVRHLPMHLHAKSLLIPEVLGGQNFFVHCRLPKHFLENMKNLKLKIRR
ncbi:hypothetical protein ScPMuIL_006153 [Solemya velum]